MYSTQTGIIYKKKIHASILHHTNVYVYIVICVSFVLFATFAWKREKPLWRLVCCIPTYLPIVNIAHILTYIIIIGVSSEFKNRLLREYNRILGVKMFTMRRAYSGSSCPGNRFMYSVKYAHTHTHRDCRTAQTINRQTGCAYIIIIYLWRIPSIGSCPSVDMFVTQRYGS